MSYRRILSIALLIAMLALICGLTLATAQPPAPTAPAPPAPAFTTASGRSVFWRGERIICSLTAPMTEPAAVTVTLTGPRNVTLPLYRGQVQPVDGQGYLNLLLPTQTLGDGDYTVSAMLAGQPLTCKVSVRDTTVTSPGMIMDESSATVPPNSRLVGQTGAINFMTDGRFNVTWPTPSESPAQMNAIFDNLADSKLLFWNHDASRPFSFIPPHSSPFTDGEYLRRIMLGNTIMMRYPAFAGQLFDYDHEGFYLEGANYANMSTYWGWGNLNGDLQKYLDTEEQALIQNYRKVTGKEPVFGKESAQLSTALHIPEGMGYIDMPSRRWAYEVAARSPQMAPAQLAALKDRAFSWYDYLMSVNYGRYTNYLHELRALDPTLMHSTSNTINHSTPRQGGYHPTSYEPLDFRFVAVWDDQGGAPEHIYETQLAATLLNGNRRPEQPLWIDTVFGWQNGNHFRNTVQVMGRGGQGTGYSMEMGSNLSAHAAGDLQANAPANQEMALNAQLMERFGGLFANAHHTANLGLLYSKRQITITPYAQSYCDGSFKMLYLLSHIGLPPNLVTEEMLTAGVPKELDTIVVLGQTEELPEKAMQGLRAFVARGGRVIADTKSTVQWDFLEHSETLDLPFRDLGHPYNMFTAYNRQDATAGAMLSLAAERCPKLRALMQPSIANLPLDATNSEVAVSTLQGGAGTFVAVSNDSMLDYSKLFTKSQQLMASYQQLFVGHGIGAIGSWMPLRTNLLLCPTLSAGTAIYDLFTMQQVTPALKGGGRQLTCDLTGVPARIYAIYPAAVGAGRLSALQGVAAGETIDLRYQVTDAKGAPLAGVVPVEITLFAPDKQVKTTLFRATDAQGILNEQITTGLFDASGDYSLQVRQLLDGQGSSLPVLVKAGAAPKGSLVAGAMVRDPAAIRKFFDSKPEIVVPMFDPALQPLVEKVVTGLVRKGVKAREWDIPPTVTYKVGYTVNAQEQPNNDAVDRGEAIGTVPFVNGVNQLNGNFYGSAMTGYRYGKHILLLSVPGVNPVVKGIEAAGLLWSDKATNAPGGALVQQLPWALGLNAETIVVKGADLAGLEAGVNALLNLPASDPITDGVREARARMLHGHRVPLTYQTPPSTKKLTARGAATLAPQVKTPRFALAPVTDVQEVGDTLVATLGRYGNAITLVDNTGKVTAVPAITSTAKTAVGQSIFVTATPGMTFTWSKGGQPLWRAMGEFKAVQPGTDNVLVESGNTVYQVSPDGGSVKYAGEQLATDDKKTTPVFTTKITTEGAGAEERVKEIQLTDSRTGKTINGFHLTATRPYNKPFTVEQMLLEGKSGDTLLAFRRFTGEQTAQVYSRATGRVADVTLHTAYLTDAALSRDEKLVAVCGAEGDVKIADLSGKVLATLQTGPYPRLIPLRDGGFAIGTGDGLLTVLDRTGKERFTRDLIALTAGANPEDEYRSSQATRLLNWSNPPIVQGALPAENFFWYLRDEDGSLKLVNQSPGNIIDFRWMDAVQGEVQFPASKTYTITLRAAAKYFDDEPLAQPSWKSIVDIRNTVVKNERPAPAFRVYLDGKAVATVTPDGGALKPFITPPIKEGWASLNPKDNELTSFTATVDLPAGSHLLGLEALNMEDCYVKVFEVK